MVDQKPEFMNARGEKINANLNLVTDPEYGQIWSDYIKRTMPSELFLEVGLIDTPGSEEWFNVVEHSALVAAYGLALASELTGYGVSVSIEEVERAAWAHDATKRRDVMKVLSRDEETQDDLLTRLLTQYAYTEAEISAALNTGRREDRFLKEIDKRQAAIRSHSVAANIVGYADARTRGSMLMLSLQAALEDSLLAKPGETDFFEDAWLPYYRDVESYFVSIAPGFDLGTVDMSKVVQAAQTRNRGEQ